MGCLPLRFLKACTISEPSMIKVMTVDGRCLKYEAPTTAKEVLLNYPLHALFDSDAVRVQGDRVRPLHSTLFLQPGHIYFLVPQAAVGSPHCACTTGNCSLSTLDRACATSDCDMSNSNCMPITVDAALSTSDLPNMPVNDASSQSELAQKQAAKCSMSKRRVSFAAAPPAVGTTNTGKSCVQFLPSPSDGVLRVKMVVSKKQLAQVLKEGGDCVSMVEGLLSPLLEASRSDAAFSACNDISSDLSWRPSLESIPESLLT